MSMLFGDDDDDADEEDDPEAMSAPDEVSADGADQVIDPSPDAGPGPGADDRSGGGLGFGEGGGTERDIQDLEARLDDVEANVEQTSASMRSIEEQQDALSEEVEELNDRIRKLLGVYDQATTEANPFAGADDEPDGFGVIEETDDTEETDHTGTEDPEPEPEPEPAAETGQPEPADGVTDFEDLESESELEWERTENGHDPDTHDTGATNRPGHEHGPVSRVPEDHRRLEELPPTYAADIIVMQWLSMLVRRSGQAGALKSFEYYESVGWISTSVRQRLETMLSGPGIDAHVDPENPSEPTSVDHLESYTYITQLEELREVHGWGSA